MAHLQHQLLTTCSKSVKKVKTILPEKQAEMFHHNVAQLLFVYERARCYIHAAVDFLTVRFKNLYRDDWGKLKRVLKYLKGGGGGVFGITVESMLVIHWWVDKSYNACPDCKGHTRAMMALGRGLVKTLLRKQKLNVRCSTEG